jgi:type I restriction enzyme S subunit
MKVLGELLDIQNGYAFASEYFNDQGRGIPILRIRDLAKGCTSTYYDGPFDERFLVRQGDYLIGMDGEFRCYKWRGESALLNQRVCRLHNFRSEVLADYIYYGINEHLKIIESKTDFATVKHISSRQIAAIQMPVPSLAEQQQIVTVLDSAEELRRLREQADRRTADLIPALFHEMFGDQYRFVMRSLGEILTSIDSGWSPVCRDEPATNQEWGVLRLGAVTTGVYMDRENKALSERFTPRPRLEVRKGDILFTRKNTKDLVAATAYVWDTRPKLMLSDLIFRLNPRDNAGIESIYLAYALKHPPKRREIQSLASGSAGSMPNISKQRLSGVIIPVPPVGLQKNFSDHIAKIREMESPQAESRHRLDDLFQSLLHRAFRGEL